MLSHSPLEIFSQDARNEASVPFLLSAGCSALHVHLDGCSVPLCGGGTGIGPASISVWYGYSTHTTPWVLGQAKILCSWVSWERKQLCPGSWGVGAVSGRELRSPGTFLSLCLDGNSYLGSRRGSKKREGEGAGGSGLKLFSLLLDRLFLRRGFQHDGPQYKCSLLVTTRTLELLNLEEADVSFCTPLLL